METANVDGVERGYPGKPPMPTSSTLRRLTMTIAASALATSGALVITAAPAAAAPVTLFSSSTPGPATTDPVPAGICFVTITAVGGHGGSGPSESDPRDTPVGGAGATVTARLAATPGTALGVLVAGAGATGNGGSDGSVGGGGGSDGSVGGGGGGGTGADGGIGGGGGGGASVVISAAGGALVVAGGGGGGGYFSSVAGGYWTFSMFGGNGGWDQRIGLAGEGNGGGRTSAGAGGAGGSGGLDGDDGGGGGGVGGGGATGNGVPDDVSGAGVGGAGSGTGLGGGGGGGEAEGGGIGTAGGAGGTGTGVGGLGTAGNDGGPGNELGGNGGAGGGRPGFSSYGGGGGGGGRGFGGGGGGAEAGGGGGGGYGAGGGGSSNGGGGGGSSFVAAGATGVTSARSSGSGNGQVTITYDPATDRCPDTTPPTITITTPTDGAAYTQGQSVLAAYACADETTGSGIASCVGPVADGAAIDTATVGTKTFAVTATDRANNLTTTTNSYTVNAASTPDQRPDGKIRSGTVFLGNDLYNTTAAGQTVTKNAKRNEARAYEVRIQNDGAQSSSFRLLGRGSGPRYTVAYTVGTTNVTSAVVAGTYDTPTLGPTTSLTITIAVTPTSAAPIGNARGTDLTAIDGALSDTVRANTKVVS